MHRWIPKIPIWLVALGLLLSLSTIVGARMIAEASQAQPQGKDRTGVLVDVVEADSPAAKAGLVRGDIISKVGEQVVAGPIELVEALKERKLGDVVQLTVLHGDEERQLSVTLVEREGKAFLGVEPCGPEIEMAAVPAEGMLITRVVEDSPAARAGVQAGDLIKRIDGQKVESGVQLQELIKGKRAGDSITLELSRPGEEASRSVTVTLGTHPEKADRAYLGVQTMPHHEMGVIRRGGWGAPDSFIIPALPEGTHPLTDSIEGAAIREVGKDTPAAAAGLRQGDVIVAVDGQEVKGAHDLTARIAGHKPGDTITLSVRRPGEAEVQKIETTLAENPEQKGKALLGVAVHDMNIKFFRRGEGVPGIELALPPLERAERFEAPLEGQVEQFSLPFPGANEGQSF